MNKYIAYPGQFFTIEWYYDAKGYSQAFEYFNDLPDERKRKFINLFRIMGDRGNLFDITKFRNEGDSIYAFKPQPDRYLCFFFKGKKIIVTNAFMKKTEKLPTREKEKSLKAFESYETRVKAGTYYEKENN